MQPCSQIENSCSQKGNSKEECILEKQSFFQYNGDTCCFVYAVANCALYLGIPIFDIERAKDLGACRNGSVIHATKVVECFHVPLVKTFDSNLVLQHGGILLIKHPIYNGHSMFVFPDGQGSITMVNSLLGPVISKKIGHREIAPFIRNNSFGHHWVLKEK